MQKPVSFIVSFVFYLSWVLMQLPSRAAMDGNDRFPKQLLLFSAEKEGQARQLAANLNLHVAPDIWTFFTEASSGDLAGVTNTFARLRLRASQYQGSVNDPTVSSPVWQTVIEVVTAYQAFGEGGSKYPLAFGEGIIESIPAGSIYFGGTDPGRGLVTALCHSQIRGDPFYTITQNALADGRYLDYLRSMYGSRIYLPSTNVSQKVFADFMADALLRVNHDRDFPGLPKQVRPGENLQKDANGRLTVNGQVSIMEINGLLAKDIFDHNTNREFYVEESFPLDWMFPYLSPHGLIFKLNRKPLTALTGAEMDADHAFWTKQCDGMIGDWLRPETSLSNVCAFVVAVDVTGDFSHFTGDREFVTNSYMTKTFSKLRSAGANLYVWRLESVLDKGDKARLRAEADYASRQAFALSPVSPEAVFRLVNFLLSEGRINDAVLVARTASQVQPDDQMFSHLLSQLVEMRRKQKD